MASSDARASSRKTTGVHLSWRETKRTGRAVRYRLRRVLLAGAAIAPLFIILDYFNLTQNRGLALFVRLLWGLSMAAIALAIPRSSDRGLRILLATAAGVCVVLLTIMTAIAGGTTGQYFQYMVAMPMCVAVCLPVETLAAVVAGVLSLACGVALMLFEGKTPPAAMARWATLCIMSSLLAVFASRAYRRLRDAEQRSTLERQHDLQRFAAVIAHEINNQLAVLQNTIGLLRKAAADGALLAMQQETVDQMRNLTSDFVGFGDPVIGPREPVDLLDLAHAYAKVFAPHVEVSSTSEDVKIVGNRSGIARALLNVVKNGVEAGGPVKVTVGKVSGGVIVRVVDHGPGVHPDAAPRVGQPFFTTKVRGTGLGLALVRQVVSEHEGQFSLENRTEGGVRAEMWFPADS